MAMDSRAAFTELYCEQGLAAHKARFEAAGWYTCSDLVFATTFTPQNGQEDRYDADILMVGLGDRTHRDKGKLRRIFYEAYTVVGSEMRRKTEAGPSDAPRAVPNAEREARRAAAAIELKGVKLEDELDISDRLIDRAIDMYDSNVLGYLGPELCTKRGNAMMGIQRDPLWESVPNINGGFTLKRADDGRRAEFDTQFAFSFALQRRSLALHMSGVMDYTHSETLRAKFISAMMKEPRRGFLPVDLAQVLDADREFWIAMGDKVRKGIKNTIGGRPCDLAFQKVFESHDFGMAIMPMQGNVSRMPVSTAPPPVRRATTQQVQQAPPAMGKRALTRKRKLEQAAADAVAGAFKTTKTEVKQERTGRGSGSGGKPSTGARLPVKLVGMCSTSSKETGSKKFCFSYNLDGCAGAAPGASCGKGLHACMRPLANGEACSGPHQTFSCKR